MHFYSAALWVVLMVPRVHAYSLHNIAAAAVPMSVPGHQPAASHRCRLDTGHDTYVCTNCNCGSRARCQSCAMGSALSLGWLLLHELPSAPLLGHQC
jgi:hypothetical protein